MPRSEVGDKRVIVFANTKANCELVSQTLYAKGYSCTVLHSGKSQVSAWGLLL
jgi:superfamily II DNA/RNA helicase